MTDDGLSDLHQRRLQAALVRYRASADLRALGEAFAAARAAVDSRRSDGREVVRRPATVAGREGQEERLPAGLPAVEEFVEVAAGAARQAAEASLRMLWDSLALESRAPAWTGREVASARTAIVLALTREDPAALTDMQASLRRVGAGRVASLLVEGLSLSGEPTWRRVLGERYQSVFHRCAPRTGSANRGLGAVLSGDRRAGEALSRQLASWISDGADPRQLASIVESVVVHYRTPPQLA